MQKPFPWQQVVVNTVGSSSYLLSILAWAWALILLIAGSNLIGIIESTQTNTKTPVELPAVSLPSSVTIILVVFITAVMIGLAVYALFKAPSGAVRTSSRTSRQAATKISRVITRHKLLPQKQRQQLSSKIVFYIKLVFAVTPAAIVLVLVNWPNLELGIDNSIATLVSGGLTLLALLGFVLQYGLAWLLKVKLEKLL